jgi:hypothetical protein
MTPQKFIYDQVYAGAVKGKAKSSTASAHAEEAVNIFNKGLFEGKASRLIETSIKAAIKVKD